MPAYAALLYVRAGARRLLGIEPSWDAVVSRLRGYSLFQVMNTTGRIDALLRDHGSRGLNAQLRIAAGLMGPDKATALGRRVLLMQAQLAREDDGSVSNIVLFNHLQLTTFVQIAAQTLSIDDIDGGIPLDGLGEALLIVNDLLEPELLNPADADFATPEGRKAWIYYLSVVVVAPGTRPATTLIARTSDLFLSDHAHLRDHEAYINLPALFWEATNLDAQGYGLALLLFLAVSTRLTATT